MRTLVPPPAVVILCAVLIWGLRRLFPEEGIFIPGRRPIYWTLLALGFLVVFAGIFEFRRAGTTVNPMQPDKASALVTTGIYRFTRNPMYLGDALILLAVVVFFSSSLGIAGVVLFVAWMDLLQIPAEERAMKARFGEAYERYCERVRRWI